MKLLTKEIIAKMPALYSTEKIPAADKTVAVKFFCPWSNWTWYVAEGSQDPDAATDVGDWVFFGFVEGFDAEWGYFRLSELEEVSGPAGLKIERDMHFGHPRFDTIHGAV